MEMATTATRSHGQPGSVICDMVRTQRQHRASTSTSTGPVATKELELERRAPLQTLLTPLPLLCHILERACKTFSNPRDFIDLLYQDNEIYLSSILLSED